MAKLTRRVSHNDPALEASRIVGKLLVGQIRKAEADATLDALGYSWCERCYAYRLSGGTHPETEILRGGEGRAFEVRGKHRDPELDPGARSQS